MRLAVTFDLSLALNAEAELQASKPLERFSSRLLLAQCELVRPAIPVPSARGISGLLEADLGEAHGIVRVTEGQGSLGHTHLSGLLEVFPCPL